MTKEMTNKEELDKVRDKAELNGMIGTVLTLWVGGHSNKTLREMIMPPFQMPVMKPDELKLAQSKGGKLKAKSAEQVRPQFSSNECCSECGRLVLISYCTLSCAAVRVDVSWLPNEPRGRQQPRQIRTGHWARRRGAASDTLHRKEAASDD